MPSAAPTASTLAGASNTLGNADPIYGGNTAKWQKFANSLRLRLAMQIVNVDAATANTQIAAALAVPSVSIFGPTDPDRTVIPGASRVVRAATPCQPCYARECPLRDHKCMDIGVEEVSSAAMGLLLETAADGRVRAL